MCSFGWRSLLKPGLAGGRRESPLSFTAAFVPLSLSSSFAVRALGRPEHPEMPGQPYGTPGTRRVRTNGSTGHHVPPAWVLLLGFVLLTCCSHLCLPSSAGLLRILHRLFGSLSLLLSYNDVRPICQLSFLPVQSNNIALMASVFTAPWVVKG